MTTGFRNMIHQEPADLTAQKLPFLIAQGGKILMGADAF
jgi:hypothetical protein